MKIDRRIVDDLKTERPDVTPALAPYLRLVPILFYSILAGGIVLSLFFLFVLKNAASSRETWKAEIARHKQDLSNVQTARTAVEKQSRRASDIVAWVEGSRCLEPLVAAIVRSMEPGSNIIELGLTRDPSSPTQIKLTLKLSTQGSKQLDTTLERITKMNFRTYNPNQTQSRGEIDYEATLIYQNPRNVATSTPPPATPQHP